MTITELSEEHLRTRNLRNLQYILRKTKKSLGWLEGRVNGTDWSGMGGEGPPEKWIPDRDRIRAYKHLLERLIEDYSENPTPT